MEGIINQGKSEGGSCRSSAFSDIIVPAVHIFCAFPGQSQAFRQSKGITMLIARPHLFTSPSQSGINYLHHRHSHRLSPAFTLALSSPSHQPLTPSLVTRV